MHWRVQRRQLAWRQAARPPSRTSRLMSRLLKKAVRSADTVASSLPEPDAATAATCTPPPPPSVAAMEPCPDRVPAAADTAADVASLPLPDHVPENATVGLGNVDSTTPLRRNVNGAPCAAREKGGQQRTVQKAGGSRRDYKRIQKSRHGMQKAFNVHPKGWLCAGGERAIQKAFTTHTNVRSIHLTAPLTARNTGAYARTPPSPFS
eukprot:364590-Chlamydomonas_euryale.AAC.7